MRLNIIYSIFLGHNLFFSCCCYLHRDKNINVCMLLKLSGNMCSIKRCFVYGNDFVILSLHNNQ